MLANWAYFRVLSPAEVGAHKLVAAEMMQRIRGSAGASAVSIAAMISIFAALNGSILDRARGFLMRRHGTACFSVPQPGFIPAFRTPGVSILMLSGWSAVLVLSGKYEELFDFVIFGSWILYAMATASVFVLRQKAPGPSPALQDFRLSRGADLFLAGAAVLEISTLWTRPRESIAGIVLILLGLPFYFYWRGRSRRSAAGGDLDSHRVGFRYDNTAVSFHNWNRSLALRDPWSKNLICGRVRIRPFVLDLEPRRLRDVQFRNINTGVNHGRF